MRLVDADYFKERIAADALKKNIEPDKGLAFIELVEAIPTAYDLDSVIEQLEECKHIMESSAIKDCFGKECKVGDCTVCAFEKAIEIVKSGGVSVADGKEG